MGGFVLEISAIKIVLAVIILIIVPYMLGNSVLGVLKLELTLSKSYVTGLVTIWALCQMITVPLVLLKKSFVIVVVVLSVIVLAICVYGIIKKSFAGFIIKANNMTEKVALLVMLLTIGALLAITAIMQHTDADDSRFVVNAVDIVRTNKMFLTNPATGQELSIWEGELFKDITSPWAVFIACCAKLTGIHPTIMAHTILPLVLTLAVCVVYWMLSEVFLSGKTVYKCIFVCMTLLINVYGYYSVYSAETFTITRIWQGKAVVASLGIPLIFLISMWIYENTKQRGLYILLFVTSLAMCLMSGMGIIISAIMIGCVAFVYCIMKKDLSVLFKIGVSAVPCVLYYLISVVVEKGLIS